MAVRHPTNAEASAKFNEHLFKQLGRLYLLWLAGIIVGAVKISPQQIDLGGIRYQISNPEVLQGVIFFACILYYVGICANGIAHGIEYKTTNVHIKRRMIYAALQKKPTLRGRTKSELMALKAVARLFIGLGGAFFLSYMLLPLIHIAFFQQPALFTGVDAIFGTKSVENGKVVLNSAPSLFLAWFILCVFTSMFYNWIRRRSGANFQNILWASMASTLLYTSLDSWIRSVETWHEALPRVILVQLLVLAVVCLYLFPLKVLHWYLDAELWWYRRLNRKREEKRKAGEKKQQPHQTEKSRGPWGP